MLLVTKEMRQVLDIEFAHLRIYINQPALAAVVQRCMSTPLTPTASRMNGGGILTSLVKHEAIPAHILQKHIGEERPFVNDIVDAAQALLSTADDLRPATPTAADSRIKCAPARTYLRIFTAATMLLKV